MNRTWRAGVVLILLCAAGAAPGCVSSPAPSPAARRTVSTKQGKFDGAPSRQTPASRTPTTPAARRRRQEPIDTDPCAQRLHAVAGAMLLHYALHHRLPETLEGLRGLADVDRQMEFTCPVSGERYSYTATGLGSEGRDERLIVYDASPVHGGSRWVVQATPPRGRQPPATWVVELPEAVFLTYQAPVTVPGPAPDDAATPDEAKGGPTPGRAKPDDVAPRKDRPAPANELE